MEKQTRNILLLVIAGGLGYYLWQNYKKKQEEDLEDALEDMEENEEESVTYVDEVIDRPFPVVTYKFIQPHSVEWFSSPTSKGTKTFQIGDIVETKRKSGGTLVTYTTLNGTAPDFDIAGQPWLEIPLDKLEEVVTMSFTGIDNFFKGHSQNCSGLNCV
jgi:hypothetical protein